jgi:hypothetical protein
MHPDFDDLECPENRPRWTMEGSLDGVKVTVATGYSASTDAWPYHVYVALPNGERRRLSEDLALLATTKAEACYQGLQIAADFIRRQAGGFQKEVS